MQRGDPTGYITENMSSCEHLVRVIATDFNCLRNQNLDDICAGLFFLESDLPLFNNYATSTHIAIVYNWDKFEQFRKKIRKLFTEYNSDDGSYSLEYRFFTRMLAEYILAKPLLLDYFRTIPTLFYYVEIAERNDKKCSFRKKICQAKIGLTNLRIPTRNQYYITQQAGKRGRRKIGTGEVETVPRVNEMNEFTHSHAKNAKKIVTCLEALKDSGIYKNVCRLGVCEHDWAKCEIYRIVTDICKLDVLPCYTGECDCERGRCNSYRRLRNQQTDISDLCESGTCGHYTKECRVTRALKHLFQLQNDVRCLFDCCDGDNCKGDCTLIKAIDFWQVNLKDLRRTVALEYGFCSLCLVYKRTLQVFNNCSHFVCSECYKHPHFNKESCHMCRSVIYSHITVDLNK